MTISRLLTSTTVPDEKPTLALLQEHFAGLDAIKAELDPMCAFMLLGTIQLALRHPSNTGPTSEFMRQFKDDLITSLANGNDAVATILRYGDDPFFDRVFEDGKV